jgi:hypothetical protein
MYHRCFTKYSCIQYCCTYILHLYYLILRKFMFCGITTSQLLPIFLTQYAVSCLEGNITTIVNVRLYISIFPCVWAVLAMGLQCSPALYIRNLYTINRLRIIFHFYHGISLTLALSFLHPTPSPATAAAGLTGVGGLTGAAASHVLHQLFICTKSGPTCYRKTYLPYFLAGVLNFTMPKRTEP